MSIFDGLLLGDESDGPAVSQGFVRRIARDLGVGDIAVGEQPTPHVSLGSYNPTSAREVQRFSSRADSERFGFPAGDTLLNFTTGEAVNGRTDVSPEVPTVKDVYGLTEDDTVTEEQVFRSFTVEVDVPVRIRSPVDVILQPGRSYTFDRTEFRKFRFASQLPGSMVMTMSGRTRAPGRDREASSTYRSADGSQIDGDDTYDDVPVRPEGGFGDTTPMYNPLVECRAYDNLALGLGSSSSTAADFRVLGFDLRYRYENYGDAFDVITTGTSNLASADLFTADVSSYGAILVQLKASSPTERDVQVSLT